MRPIIVRYSHLLCKFLSHGVWRYLLLPGLDLPPHGALTRLLLPLSRRDTPAQFPATRTCGSYSLAVCAIPLSTLAACLGTPDSSAAERHPHVPTGDALRGLGRRSAWFGERRSAWFGETLCVVWGDALRGLGRRSAWFGETKYEINLYFSIY